LSESASDPASFAASSATYVASAVVSGASSAASEASTKVWGGAMAQKVKEQVPVFDDPDEDDDSYHQRLQSIIEQAESSFVDIKQVVRGAFFKATSTQGSTPKITSIANEQYSSAFAAASSVLYGTSQGTGESISSVASSKYAEAVAA
jgi:hypothetical protein